LDEVMVRTEQFVDVLGLKRAASGTTD